MTIKIKIVFDFLKISIDHNFSFDLCLIVDQYQLEVYDISHLKIDKHGNIKAVNGKIWDIKTKNRPLLFLTEIIIALSTIDVSNWHIEK